VTLSDIVKASAEALANKKAASSVDGFCEEHDISPAFFMYFRLEAMGRAL